MATLLSGLANGLVDDGISGLRRLPITHLAFQDGADSTLSRSTLRPDSLVGFDYAGIQATPIGVTFLNARRPDGETIDMALFGIAPGSFLAPEGDARDSLAGEPGLILSEEFEGDGLAVGDELTIVGVEETGADLSGLAREDVVVETKEAAYQGSPGFSGETQTMSLIRGFLPIISALIVGAFFTVWTVQRTGEIGVLKALGASSGYVIKDAVGQMTIILVISSMLGAAIAVMIGQFVGGSVPFRLEAVPILTSVGLLIALGIAGCLIAVRRITSVDPIVALHSTN